MIRDVDEIEDVECHVNFEREYNFTVEYFLFRAYFNELNKSCKRILRLFLNKISYEEIAKILNLKSAEVVRRRKYRCKESLIEKIKKDSRYLEIYSK